MNIHIVFLFHQLQHFHKGNFGKDDGAGETKIQCGYSYQGGSAAHWLPGGDFLISLLFRKPVH